MGAPAGRWQKKKKHGGSITGVSPTLPNNSEGNEDQAGEQLTPTTPDSPPANDDNKKNYTPYLIAAGVLVLGGIGYYIYKKK